MPFRPRPFLLVLLAAVVATVVAACGGADTDTGAPASARTDARQLLRDTFANGARLKSGKLDATLVARAAGAAGTSRVRVTGPFASTGDGKLPRFQFAASVQGAGRDVQAGLTWTGDRAFVSFQGVQYEVPGPMARQFEAGYEEAVKRQGGGGGLDPKALGIDPTRWLRNPRNTGQREVAGVPTIRITGAADVARMLDDIQKLAAKAHAMGLAGPGSGAPAKLTPAQRRELVRAVRESRVEVYTGRDDRILRRLVVHAVMKDETSSATVPLDLDVTIRDVGADQQIATPPGARPLSELLSKLGGLSGLGAGLSGSGGGAKGLHAYAKCLQRAGGDEAKRTACASLLGP